MKVVSPCAATLVFQCTFRPPLTLLLLSEFSQVLSLQAIKANNTTLWRPLPSSTRIVSMAKGKAPVKLVEEHKRSWANHADPISWLGLFSFFGIWVGSPIIPPACVAAAVTGVSNKPLMALAGYYAYRAAFPAKSWLLVQEVRAWPTAGGRHVFSNQNSNLPPPPSPPARRPTAPASSAATSRCSA